MGMQIPEFPSIKEGGLIEKGQVPGMGIDGAEHRVDSRRMEKVEEGDQRSLFHEMAGFCKGSKTEYPGRMDLLLQLREGSRRKEELLFMLRFHLFAGFPHSGEGKI